ncbi:hypothetical protein ZMO1_ZMOp32x030 (plasmid) [Zymomonas mobilis subsp. mobilis ZM4 = ATCC 31821]|nr:hypothetical protein ZMO1_ZMOp32x030 [Zymomonas mobilis subsp. mobilis ZM4 = ATCC 31821]
MRFNKWFCANQIKQNKVDTSLGINEIVDGDLISSCQFISNIKKLTYIALLYADCKFSNAEFQNP